MLIIYDGIKYLPRPYLISTRVQVGIVLYVHREIIYGLVINYCVSRYSIKYFLDIFVCWRFLFIFSTLALSSYYIIRHNDNIKFCHKSSSKMRHKILN